MIPDLRAPRLNVVAVIVLLLFAAASVAVWRQTGNLILSAGLAGLGLVLMQAPLSLIPISEPTRPY